MTRRLIEDGDHVPIGEVLASIDVDRRVHRGRLPVEEEAFVDPILSSDRLISDCDVARCW